MPAQFWAREAIPRPRWAGAGLAFAGLVLLLLPGASGPVSLWHAGLMAVSGVGWGIYSLAGRGARDPLAATAANFVLAFGVVIVLALLAAFLLPPTVVDGTVPTRGLWLAILSGAVTSGLGYALWYGLVPQLGAARAAVAQLTVPVLASFGGLVILGEGVGLRFVAASVLVLGGVALASLIRRQGRLMS